MFLTMFCRCDLQCLITIRVTGRSEAHAELHKIHTRQDYDEHRAPLPKAIFQTCLGPPIVLGWRVETYISLQLLILDMRNPFAARCPCASPRSRVHGILFNEASMEVGFLWKVPLFFCDQHSLRCCKSVSFRHFR